MTAKITLTWDNGSSEHVDQIVYRSAETFTVDNLPSVLARVGRNAREHTDTDLVTGNVYFYAVASENAVGEVLLSSVISVTAESSGGDPHWDKVVSLLHFDGAGGSTTFDDDAGRSWTAAGTAQIDNVQAGAFGGASGLFDGAGARITTPSSAGLAFGTGDFTIEMRVRQVGPVSQWRELFMVNATSGLNIMLFDGKLVVGRENTASDYTAPEPVALGDWYHLAISRVSGVVYGFVNGTLAFSGAYGHDFSQLATVSIGAKSGGVSAFAGHIDELRVSKGVARYTENFTPPTEPFPNF